ncbi:hypothetical protein ACFQ6N_32890 [Kitasatospora sp. NPDC056446]|uniref:hypothetical protein n=1 Tax=Kitasatospora sp. NPDC056446 TaxID=3345819 RepID=UPI003696EFA7
MRARWWTSLALLALLAVATAPAMAAVPVPEPSGTPKLTLHATTGTGTESRTYLLLASGPPPANESLLVDEQGRHPVRAIVTAEAGTACTTGAPRPTGLGTDPWCVHLTGVAAGKSVSGKLAGPGGTVALALVARQGIYPPLVAALLTLVAAVFTAWAASQGLPRLMDSRLLRRERRKCAGIDGMQQWATDAAKGRLATADIVARMRWARRFGQAQVRATRADLAGKLTALPDCPLRANSQAEVDRGDDVTRADLLTDGGARADNAAEHLLQLVEQATEGLEGFLEVADSLIDRIPAALPARAEAVGLRSDGADLAEAYLSAFTIDDYLAGLRDYLSTIEDKVRAAGVTPLPTHTAFAGPALFAAGTRASLTAAGRRVQTATATLVRASAAFGAVLLLTGALMVVAVGGVLVAQYLPNPTFGTFNDYATLTVTAFGSAQIAAILAALIQLKGPADWYG